MSSGGLLLFFAQTPKVGVRRCGGVEARRRRIKPSSVDRQAMTSTAVRGAGVLCELCQMAVDLFAIFR